MKIRPILFNTEMVRAILEGRKTVTRRAVKIAHGGALELHDDPGGVLRLCERCGTLIGGLRPPYQPGDILYVRETWARHDSPIDGVWYGYRADGRDETPDGRWHPSIHMPREAARIFLRVTDVRVELVQEIDDAGAFAEGAGDPNAIYYIGIRRGKFAALWDGTIKPKDRDRYGWEANPYVWVIEFEPCEKPEGFGEKGAANEDFAGSMKPKS